MGSIEPDPLANKYTLKAFKEQNKAEDELVSSFLESLAKFFRSINKFFHREKNAR